MSLQFCFMCLLLLVLSPVSTNQLPVAPHPREKLPAGKLIIGTWNLVEFDGGTVPKHWSMHIEFQESGTFIMVLNDGKSAVTSGTYRIIDDRLHFDREASPHAPAMKWSIVIDHLSGSELIIGGKSKPKVLHKQAVRRP